MNRFLRKKQWWDFFDIFQRTLTPPSFLGILFTILSLAGVVAYGIILFEDYQSNILEETKITATSGCSVGYFLASEDCYIQSHGKQTEETNIDIQPKKFLKRGKNQSVTVCPGSQEALSVGSLSWALDLIDAGSRFVKSALSDESFGYFGCDVVPGKVIKVLLSNLSEVDSVTFNFREDSINTAITDGMGYAYYGTSTQKYTTPGVVVKVRQKDMKRVGAVSLNSGENAPSSSITDGTWGWFGLITSPGKVVRVLLSNLTRVDSLTLNSGEEYLNAAFFDGYYGYFCTVTFPAIIVKVDLLKMQRVGAVTLNIGENSASSAFYSNNFGYVGLNSVPGQVVKVDLATMKRVGSVSLHSGEDRLFSAISDGMGFGYFGTKTSPGRVVKIKLSTLERIGAVTLADGENELYAVTKSGDWAYYGTNTMPAKIVRVRLTDLARYPVPLGSLTIGETSLDFPSSIDNTENSLFLTENHYMEGNKGYSIIPTSPNAPTTALYPCNLNEAKKCYRVNLAPTMMNVRYFRKYSIQTAAGALGGFAAFVIRAAGMLLTMLKKFRWKKVVKEVGNIGNESLGMGLLDESHAGMCDGSTDGDLTVSELNRELEALLSRVRVLERNVH